MFAKRPTPKVFAYYFLATSTYGWTKDDYKRDIQEAQAIGVDGFAVAAGGWSAEVHYQGWMTAMFQAAEELDSGFVLFVSAEVGGALTAADVKDMVNTYKSSPVYLHVAGKPLLVTSQGQDGPGHVDSETGRAFWMEQVFVNGFDAAFYPAFKTVRPVGGAVDTDTPTYAQIAADWNTWWSGVVDGLYFFTFGGIPDTLIASEEGYAQLMAENSRLYLAGISAYYGQTRKALGYLATYEMRGGEGVAEQWDSIINVQRPHWVMLNTWNDQGETYMCPATTAELSFSQWDDFPTLYCHVGYTELMRFYIEWFKTRKQPTITNDRLFYFYRTHSKELVPTVGSPTAAFWQLEDNIYVTTILTAPATVRVTSGGVVTDTDVAAGIVHTRVPFGTGAQNIKLVRGGVTLIDLDGVSIDSTVTHYNVNPNTGFGVYP